MSAKISVIIPVHNTAKYLDRCMESVLGQTFGDIEVILAENLSTDGSADMCDDYARRDSRVRVLHLDRAGQSNARNVALTVASASIICFIDSDDYVNIDMLDTLYSIMVQHDADMVCSNFVYEHDGIIKLNDDDDGAICVLNRKQATTKFLMMEINNSPCTKLIKKSLFNDVKFPVGHFYEDHATMHLVAYKCNKTVWLRHSFYHYIQHNASTIHTWTPQKQYDFFLAEYARYCFIEEHKTFFGSDYNILVNIYAERSFKHLRLFLRHKQSVEFDDMKCDMIAKLSLMALNKELKFKTARRLWVIKNMFPLFYLIHVAFRIK